MSGLLNIKGTFPQEPSQKRMLLTRGNGNPLFDKER